ncbi:FKBP-type peptidyl-prolyl cis-trans isomerase [Marinicellulosiphila megalodicopiae]|uniref:FKBP-type peptidyl-prolyl cis-trans isomerase n=1 Tax=Marinicellulosiphila megalodicopiae TaxID=2724896 RepID=UPI003BB09E40
MKIANNSAVAFHYTLKNDEGEVVDTSEGQAPLAYLHGAANIVPGLENALEGLEAGAAFEVSIDAKDGYGDINPELIHSVTREQLQGVEDLEVGMMFTAQNGDQVAHFTVTEIEGDDITVDGNHPMAGRNLHFSGTVETVREATEEELAHKHIHGEGGHQH